MSGDVQPRKRKDKKKKKDELGVEEPRGTAAALGEGDVFIHTQQDNGTGGHWCAKIIFFSLLAILITLIGLIILENRGLTELEANSVESRYSGVLEGWLEDAPDDDHHDEHTLDLKHHDDEEGEDEHNIEESDHEDEDEDEDDHEDEDHDDEEDHEDEESLEDTEADADDVDQDESQEDNIEADEDEEENVASNEVDSNEEDDNQSEENLQDNEDVEEKVTYKWYQDNEEDDEDNDGDEDGEIINDNKDDDDDDSNNEYYGQNDGDDDDDDDQDDENDYQKDDDEEKNDDLDEQSYNDVDQNDDQSVEDNDQYGEDDDDSKELNQDSDLSNEITYENDNDDDDDDNESNEQKDNEQENEVQEEEEEDSQEDDDEEIEKIEKEVDEDDDSNEIVAHTNADGDEQEASKEDREADDDDDDDDDLQDQEDDEDEPPLERITAQPAGKPFVEIEEEIIEKPVNTLAEEEEYERRQEQLRREEEDAAQGSQIWLKLAVGGALLVATHAVVRRATAPRDIPEPEEHTREETPIVDRRMTIVPEQPSPRVQESPLTQIAREIEEEVFKKPAPVTKSAPIVKQYSEEEEAEDEEEEQEDIEEPLKEFIQKKSLPVVEQKPSEDSEPEDVEIVDDEQIEEELEDEEIEDEEEISDVDDTELLTRLEAKYGRLPEPERFGRKPDMSSFGPKHKDGGNSIEDDWPGEPSEAYWRTELNVAQEELRQGDWSSCERRVSAAALAGSGRARWLAARAADLAAEAKRDNSLLSRAIAAYLHLLKMNERLSDKKLLEVAQRAIDRIQFRGTYLNAEPIYRLLIRRFPDDVHYRNNLTVSFLMANRADLADEVLKETLRLWPNDRVALAHHGFVLKTQYNKLEEAVKALYKALEGDAGPANEPRFYYHLGDALLLLGRPEEAHEVHKRGAALGHFLSPAQRSLYNVPRLRSRPWWPVEETPYVNLARALERSWRDILKEGEAAKELYEKEKEGLKERGEWTQLDVFVRGAEIPGRCARAPVTCSIVRSEAAAARCRRGQVKFSAMEAGTHVRAHVGPTNCRLRMHLGLSNTKNTYIRVDKETRQWQTGKTFIFDDSFEHEVWHNGSGARLVLIVDVWHPDLSAHERRTLPAI
nr:aspartyl/asparaginyl beta-hydroxylase-like [Maniola hyperantus]